MTSTRVSLVRAAVAFTAAMRSIDIRAIAVRSVDDWRSILTTIRLSSRTIDAVRVGHEELRRTFPGFSNSVLNFSLDVLPFEELAYVLDGLKQGILNIGGVRIRPSQRFDVESAMSNVARHYSLIGRDTPGLLVMSSCNATLYHNEDVVRAVRNSTGLMPSEFVHLALDVKDPAKYATDVAIFFEVPARIVK